MATHTPVISYVARGVVQARWSGTLASGDTVVFADLRSMPDKTIHITSGTHTGTLTIQGSATATGGRVTLTDPSGTALTFAAAGSDVILQNPGFIGFKTSGGTVSNLVVTIVATRGG